MNLTQQIESLLLKTKQLALKLERLQHENSTLKEESALLQKEIDRNKEMAGKIREKTKKVHVAVENEAEGNAISAEQLKQQLNQYIDEIDKCIEWLHNN